MTTLFKVIEVNDYVDSINKTTIFHTLDEKKAVCVAKKYFKEAMTEYKEHERPNILNFEAAFKALERSVRGRLQPFIENYFVEAVPMEEMVSRSNTEIVWTPTIEDMIECLRKSILDLFMFDLQIKPSEEEINELISLFKDNAKLFREKDFYGVTKHAGELLKLLDAEKREEVLMDIENKVK